MVEQSHLNKQIEQIEHKLSVSVEMVKKEELFIEKANIRFEKNLLAFKQYLPDVYEKFVYFNPKSDFNLFLNSDGTPNILDYVTKCPIYSEAPMEQVDAQIHNLL